MRKNDALLGALLLLGAGSCMSPEVEAKQWDEIQAVSASVTELRGYVSELQTIVDSLTIINAKQDTALRLIADFTGAIVPGYRQD